MANKKKFAAGRELRPQRVMVVFLGQVWCQKCFDKTYGPIVRSWHQTTATRSYCCYCRR